MISFSIINLLVGASIKERTYEIGIIRALGGTKKDIKGIYILESAIMGIISAIMGFVLFQLVKVFVVFGFMEEAYYTVGMTDILVSVLCFALI